MQDPISNFFQVTDPSRPVLLEEDNPQPMGAVEEEAIREDVELVREKLKESIKETSSRIPDLLDLAFQMQEPAMMDSATRMLTALSKLSTDLIGVDLRVLQESKKTGPREPVVLPGEEPEVGKQRVVTEATAAEILNIINKSRAESQ